MAKIYKYTIEEITDDVWLDMPAEAKIIHIAPQSGMICIWALVEPLTNMARRHFCILTGHQVRADLIYLGTVHIAPFVWHLFEELTSKQKGDRGMK